MKNASYLDQFRECSGLDYTTGTLSGLITCGKFDGFCTVNNCRYWHGSSSSSIFPVVEEPSGYFISIRGDGLTGSGTYDEPWDGSDYYKLTQILNSIPTYSKITFMSGTYDLPPGYTNYTPVGNNWSGTWSLKNGWFFCGEGEDKTTIRMYGRYGNSAAAPSITYGMYGANKDVTLSGFTWDLQGQDTGLYPYITLYGIYMASPNNVLVKDVTIKNVIQRRMKYSGTYIFAEGFLYFFLGGYKTRIENCTVSGLAYADDTISIYALADTSTDQNNPSVDFDTCWVSGCYYTHGDYPLWSGSHAHAFGSSRVTDCESDRAFVGWYTDTWSMDRIEVKNCIFRENLYFNIDRQAENSSIYGREANSITIEDCLFIAPSSGVWQEWIDNGRTISYPHLSLRMFAGSQTLNPTCLKRLIIRNNRFYVPSGYYHPLGYDHYAIQATNMDEVIIENNYLDKEYPTYNNPIYDAIIQTCERIEITNNKKSKGADWVIWIDPFQNLKT